MGKQPRIRRRVGTWRAADRRLIDINHFVDILQPTDRLVLQRHFPAAIEMPGKESIERLINEGRFARPGHTGDTGKHAQRDINIDILKIIATGLP